MNHRLAWLGFLLLPACAGRCAPRGCPPEPAARPVARSVESPPAPAPVVQAKPAVEPGERAIQLRRMRKEVRWELARGEVGLRPEQVDRLKEAVAERDRSLEGKTGIMTRMMGGLPLSTVMGDDDEWRTFAYVGAIEHADAELDARAKAILSPDQWEKWSGGGFSRAFGLRLPHVPPAPVAVPKISVG